MFRHNCKARVLILICKQYNVRTCEYVVTDFVGTDLDNIVPQAHLGSVSFSCILISFLAQLQSD